MWAQGCPCDGCSETAARYGQGVAQPWTRWVQGYGLQERPATWVQDTGKGVSPSWVQDTGMGQPCHVSKVGAGCTQECPVTQVQGTGTSQPCHGQHGFRIRTQGCPCHTDKVGAGYKHGDAPTVGAVRGVQDIGTRWPCHGTRWVPDLGTKVSPQWRQ